MDKFQEALKKLCNIKYKSHSRLCQQCLKRKPNEHCYCEEIRTLQELIDNYNNMLGEPMYPYDYSERYKLSIDTLQDLILKYETLENNYRVLQQQYEQATITLYETYEILQPYDKRPIIEQLNEAFGDKKDDK